MNYKERRENMAKLFNGKSEIIISNKNYKRLVGDNFPQDCYYLLNKSAFADEALKHGYELILVTDRKVTARKVD